jgi:hypothetical protein
MSIRPASVRGSAVLDEAPKALAQGEASGAKGLIAEARELTRLYIALACRSQADRQAGK